MLVPGTVALAALVVLLGLGTWQLERKAWKEALIVTLDRRLNDAPIALPPPYEWTGMTPENSEFTRVRLRVEFPKTSDALVYTSGSAIRDDVKGAGYFVFSPARLPNGQQVVVNRGFVPNRSYPVAAGTADIVTFDSFHAFDSFSPARAAGKQRDQDQYSDDTDCNPDPRNSI